jgi:precorrin-6Y C5,15-methyltransferase (decarboxylating)
VADRVVVVGLHGDGRVGLDGLTAAAREAIAGADLVIGAARHLAAVGPTWGEQVDLWGDIPAVVERVAAASGTACVLASGDPGFFGIVRPLAERFGSTAVAVHPAPSSVSLAFARLGTNWDDAVVVSAHGRPLGDAARLAARLPKVAVLVSRDSPASALGAALIELGATHTVAAVCSRLGTDAESVTVTDLAGLAAGAWDPLSVVVLGAGPRPGSTPSLAWGLPETVYAHRDGMITKAEVRAVVLAALALPGPSRPAPVLWDLGAGSGSVAVECARMAPWLEVLAVEAAPEDAGRIRANAAASGAAVRVIEGRAPEVLAGLPDPDRVFVGGGGVELVDAAQSRLRPSGRVVASFAALDRAAAAADRLGALTQVSVSRGVRLPDGGWRLEAANPVFVVWGPP